MSSSKGLLCSGGNPLATWRTIAMISCTISPRAPPVASRSKIPHRGADHRLGVVRIHPNDLTLTLPRIRNAFADYHALRNGSRKNPIKQKDPPKAVTGNGKLKRPQDIFRRQKLPR